MVRAIAEVDSGPERSFRTVVKGLQIDANQVGEAIAIDIERDQTRE